MAEECAGSISRHRFRFYETHPKQPHLKNLLDILSFCDTIRTEAAEGFIFLKIPQRPLETDDTGRERIVETIQKYSI